MTPSLRAPAVPRPSENIPISRIFGRCRRTRHAAAWFWAATLALSACGSRPSSRDDLIRSIDARCKNKRTELRLRPRAPTATDIAIAYLDVAKYAEIKIADSHADLTDLQQAVQRIRATLASIASDPGSTDEQQQSLLGISRDLQALGFVTCGTF